MISYSQVTYCELSCAALVYQSFPEILMDEAGVAPASLSHSNRRANNKYTFRHLESHLHPPFGFSLYILFQLLNLLLGLNTSIVTDICCKNQPQALHTCTSLSLSGNLHLTLTTTSNQCLHPPSEWLAHQQQSKSLDGRRRHMNGLHCHSTSGTSSCWSLAVFSSVYSPTS